MELQNVLLMQCLQTVANCQSVIAGMKEDACNGEHLTSGSYHPMYPDDKFGIQK